MEYRASFDSLLVDKPAEFFEGVPLERLSPMEAATSPASAQRVGRHGASEFAELDEQSLHAVFEAAQWPEDYDDPLDSHFSEKDEVKLRVRYPGLRDYLEHKQARRRPS